MGSTKSVMRRAMAGGTWRAPDMRELRAHGYETGAQPVYGSFGLHGFVVGEPSVLWNDGSKTTAREIADPAGGWEPIGDDAPPVEPPPVGTKRWIEALALECTGVRATARNAGPGILIELAGEPRRDSVGALVWRVAEWCKVAFEVRWTETRETL